MLFRGRSCVDLYIEEKLNKPTVLMTYANYQTNIQLAHRVRLRNWPKKIKFAPPSTINIKAEVRLLLEALKDGECIWVSMTVEEVKILKNKLKEEGIQKKVRGTRKDKGGTHLVQKGKRKQTNENEDPSHDTRPVKKSKVKGKKKAQLPPRRATPLLDDTSDSDNDGL